jgi:hypothetical protein
MFKSLFRFYINSSIHVAFAILSLLILTFLRFEIKIDLILLLFVFLASVTGYNFVKYAPVAKLHHKSLTQRLQIIQLFSLCCFIGLLVVCFFVKTEIIAISIALGFINLIYAVPLPKKSLREIPLLKVFIIAIIWAIVTVIFPFLYIDTLSPFNELWVFEIIERFFLVVLLMVPFEIRDYQYDKSYLKTIVMVMGIRQTKLFAISLIVLFFSIRILVGLEIQDIVFYSLLYLSLGIFISISSFHQKPYFASFWVESLPIFWMLTYILMNS